MYSVNSSFYFSPLQWRIHLLLSVFCLSTELKSVCQAFLKISLCFGRPAQEIGCNLMIEIPVIQNSLLGLQQLVHYHHLRGIGSNADPSCIYRLATLPDSETSQTWSQEINKSVVSDCSKLPKTQKKQMQFSSLSIHMTAISEAKHISSCSPADLLYCRTRPQKDPAFISTMS
ncbi:hypothetical protein MTR67_046040 [Solanum verrucosum]|uniref:Uncharacterized protein n=1 Tax=Solanum verrucosum TaxID=315347 RepID=A0AAF0ZX74_SOLVR|nr:hypothetical protein MTR67_046040 [Solanum verrucosum]